MPWSRYFIGHAQDRGLIHLVYEHGKDGRVFWDSQCNIQWAGRDNTSQDRRPLLTKKPVTCVACIGYETKIPGWIERTR
jgi:hypothetical protein